MKSLIFFSLNDFEKTSGGSIRMYGILNALAEKGYKITFISNASNYERFHNDIKHINLHHTFSSYDKRLFQFLLSFFNYRFVNILFRTLKYRCSEILLKEPNAELFFFEYVDNSIGYWLYKNQIISNYINDIHGLANEEFTFQINQAKTLKTKLLLMLKRNSAKSLDKKVYSHSKYIITPTKAMLQYLIKSFPVLETKKNLLIPNAVQDISNYNTPNHELINKLKKEFAIKNRNKVILFAGGFKRSSGLLTLINAFQMAYQQMPNLKLLILGDGYLMESAQSLVKENNLQRVVHFIGRTQHVNLRSYQEISDLIVCPDDQNIFSNLIIHYKYIDALLANKIVINGNFKSVLEINPNEKLSIGFEPSNHIDLANAIMRVFANYNYYKVKYSNTRKYVLDNMTYSSFFEKLNLLDRNEEN